jgi:hypothetical protein
VYTSIILVVVKELGFQWNVRSVEPLHMAQYIPLREDQHTLPYFDPIIEFPGWSIGKGTPRNTHFKYAASYDRTQIQKT